ncbi:MAG: DUF3102 domain-containing protein [Scytonematopsis contorta HA4267-MV1]|jgi:hypothetical protein|nr:DUF3102 domain-containing protein [Scytonematopsis contorta HA4267-MV1]
MRHVSLPSETTSYSNQETHKFEYAILEIKTRTIVMQHTNDIKALMRRTCEDIIRIGQKLLEVKQFLGHGNFMSWLKSEFNWSMSIATKYMQVAKQFKTVNFTNLNITASALYLIAAPSTPDIVRAEVLNRASCGESISYTKTKQIMCQYKKNAHSQITKFTTLENSRKPQESNFYLSTEEKNQIRISQILHFLPPVNDLNEAANIDSIDNFTTPVTEQDNIINISMSEDLTQKQQNLVNTTPNSGNASSTEIVEMAVKVIQFTPEELALIISESAKNGLTNQHLQAIIVSSEQALNARQNS